MAFRIFNLCANGMGGVDWKSVPMWCGFYGVADVEDLMHRLTVIKLHKREES